MHIQQNYKPDLGVWKFWRSLEENGSFLKYDFKTLYSTDNFLAPHFSHLSITFNFEAPSKMLTTAGHLLHESLHLGPD